VYPQLLVLPWPLRRATRSIIRVIRVVRSSWKNLPVIGRGQLRLWVLVSGCQWGAASGHHDPSLFFQVSRGYYYLLDANTGRSRQKQTPLVPTQAGTTMLEKRVPVVFRRFSGGNFGIPVERSKRTHPTPGGATRRVLDSLRL
jgi:hypothetical protein